MKEDARYRRTSRDVRIGSGKQIQIVKEATVYLRCRQDNSRPGAEVLGNNPGLDPRLFEGLSEEIICQSHGICSVVVSIRLLFATVKRSSLLAAHSRSGILRCESNPPLKNRLTRGILT